MKYIKFLVPALFAGFIAACGGGSSAPVETPVSVALSAQVYDQAVANATVEVFVGANTTPVATTTTDENGNWSVNLSVTEEARANNCVVVARRDNISLRSLLGNVGAITDTATANSGTVTATELPSANVTNVSTAVAAIVEQSGGSLPSSQAEIEAALDVIANDTTLQQTVIQIAAAIKAVVDYAGDTTSLGTTITNTEELAAALVASTTLADDLTTLIASSDATDIDQLVLEVEGDPLLATQIPSDEATLVAGMVGNTYVTNNTLGEETLVRVDTASTVTIADYSDIETGGIAGTYTDNQDGTLTVNFTDPVDGPLTVVMTVTGGSANAINTNIVVNGTDEGPHTFRRLIPVAATGSTTQIGTADLAGKIFVYFDDSEAIQFGSTCDGSTANVSIRSSAGELPTPATCNTALGMVVISYPNGGKSMHGLLADSWNGTAISQQVSTVDWDTHPTLGSVAIYPRLYTPIDSGTPIAGAKRLRIYPNNSLGAVSSQLQFVTAVDATPGNGAADGGNIDVYRVGNASSKDLYLGETTSVTGSLKVNGSVNPGQPFGTHASTSISMNLGNNANARLSAIIQPANNTYPGRILSRYQYNLRNIVSADVSGKTFSFTDLVNVGGGIVVFNTDGTGTFTETGGVAENFNWSIADALPPSASTSSATSTVTTTASYGTTLKMEFTDVNIGGTDYVFAKDLGGSIILAGYYIDSNGLYEDTWAGLATPQ